MARKQTRRSVSLSKEGYDKLRAYCESHGISMSQAVEAAVDDAYRSLSGFIQDRGLRFYDR